MKDLLTESMNKKLWGFWRDSHAQRAKIAVSAAMLLLSNSLAIAQQRLDINKKNVPVVEVIQHIRSNSEYSFVFDSDAIKRLKNVSVQLKDATVNQVLDACLSGTNFTYTVDSKTIIIKPKPAPTQMTITVQAAKQVSGTVKGQDGKPLSGVIIHLLGTELKTITDQTGRFSLAYPQDTQQAKIRVSLIGKKAQEIDLKDRKEINVTLEDEVQALEDVVVTGIFNKSKATYTGASREISSAELQQFKGRNLFVTLGNIDPAFYVVPNNVQGSNPNLIPDVQLRGTTSLPNITQLQDGTSASLNTPLIILDNFETTMRRMMDLDINEVENISLLRDGAATAMYGSRGANGVIVITTKPPVPGKLSVYYKTGLNFSLPDLSSYNLLNAREKLELEERSGYYAIASRSPLQQIKIEQYHNEVKGLVESGVNTDWLAKPLRTGIDQTHNLRLDGGDRLFRFSLSANYNDVQGVMKGSGRKSFNGGLNLTYQYDKVTFRNNTVIGNTRSEESPYGSFSDYAKLNPYWSPYDANGNIVRYFSPFQEDYWADISKKPFASPFYDASLKNYERGNTTNITNNFQIEFRPVIGLIMRGSLGVMAENRTLDDFKPASHSMFNNYGDDELFLKGRYIYGSGKSFQYTGNFNTTYARLFAEKHSVYVGTNIDIAQNENTSYTFSAQGFPDESVDFLGMALQYERGGKPSGNESKTRRIGVLANANYAYDTRFLLDLTYRLDGASQFGANRRFAPFWSAGIGWNLHNENFVREALSFIEHLKLRGSFGRTGSTQFSAYQAQSVYQYNMSNSYNGMLGAYQQSLGNPDLAWQSTDNYNAGVELKLFKSRLNITGDIYRKSTSNLLSALDLPYSNGFTSYNENIGSLRDDGFELSASTWIIPSNKGPWSWSITANIAHNRDRITKLSKAMKEANAKLISLGAKNPNKIFREGESQNTVYVVRSLGVDPSNGKEIFLTDKDEITYEWNANYRVAAGILTPKYRGNFSTLVRYKSFTFNASFGFRTGGQLYNSTVMDKVEFANKYFNVDSRVLYGRWAKPGDQTPFKGLNDQSLPYSSSRFVQNEKSLFLQNITVNYDIVDRPWLQRAKIRTLSIGANTGESFYLSSIRQERGTGYPFTRQVSFNVSVLF